MPQICDIQRFLEQLAPLNLSEDWDNVGLLVGDRTAEANRIMTCLTVTPATVQEAVAEQANLIVTHHPFPFRSLKRLTTDSTVGRMLLQLVEKRIAIYSAHTAFDSCANGINQKLSKLFGLSDIQPLQTIEGQSTQIGVGRYGSIASTTLEPFCQMVKQKLAISGLHIVGDGKNAVKKVGIACGSAGQFLDVAIRNGCDTFVTGEANFHTCLEAEARNVNLILPGHFASERFAMEEIGETIKGEFSNIEVWASRSEIDPLVWIA